MESILRLIKRTFNNKTRVKWLLILFGTFILIVLINNVFLKKMEFFPLKSENSFNNGNIHQHVVISNPLKKLDSLASIVEKYSKLNFNLCEIVEKNNGLRVFFYKETWDTPRDFKSTDDDCNFGSEYIGCHTDDIIGVLEYDKKQKNKWKFSVRKNLDSDWINYPFILKCDKKKDNQIMNEIEFIIYVRDQQKSKRFYENVLRISPSLDVPGMTEFKLAENVTLGIMPENGIAKIISTHLPHPKKGNGIPRCEIYLRVKNPSKYIAKGIELGGKEISKLQKRDWGDKVGYISDIDGHILAFAKKE